MTLPSLAEADDVRAVLQRDLTANEDDASEALLEAASALFRGEARQQFTPGESTVRLKVNGGRVRLDQRPCTDVTSVVTDRGDDVSYTRNGGWLSVDLDSSQFVTVTYQHGDNDVPPAVRTAVAEMVARALVVPEEVMAGARSTSDATGPITQTTAWSTRAPSSGLQLSDSDRALARFYRWPGGQVVVQAP